MALLASVLVAFAPAASARAASPLSWAAPVLIDQHSPGLSGVSCPSPSLCVAVDGAGNVITSTTPTGGASAWTVSHVDSGNQLRGVSCPSASLCVAVDGAGNVITSTTPTGGASAWTVSDVDSGNALDGVSCPSVSLCVAVGNGSVVASTNPTGGAGAWNVTQEVGRGMVGVSCASVSLCVAIDSNDDVVSSTDPAGGAGAWTATQIENGNTGLVVQNTLIGVSCPSTSLCAVIDLSGHVFTSTNPAAGASAWSQTGAAGGYGQGVSCASTSLCLALVAPGSVATSSDPTGDPSVWTASHVDGTNTWTGVSCPSSSFCAAVDSAGNVLTATVITASPPRNVFAPAVVGVPEQGHGLIAWPGIWAGNPSSVAWQWQRCTPACTTIPAATQATYTPTAKDVGAKLRAIVTTSNRAGSRSAASAEVGPIARSAAVLKAGLRREIVPRGRRARIGALVADNGAKLPFRALGAGRATIAWYHAGPAHRRSLVARGATRFSSAKQAKIAVHLTGAGRRLLQHATHLKLTATGTFTFTPRGRTTVTVTFTIRR